MIVNLNIADQIGLDQDEYEKRVADTFSFRLAHQLKEMGIISNQDLTSLCLPSMSEIEAAESSLYSDGDLEVRRL